MRDLEEVTRPDVLLLKYDIDAMRERWLRTEQKYDRISRVQKNIDMKTNIVIATQIVMLVLLGIT